MSSAVARWLHCWSPWSSQPGESCASVSQRKASDEGGRVPLLIRAVLAIINRCWQELKFGTNLSHFTVRHSQIQQRGRERLCERELVSFTRPAGPPVRRPDGAFVGLPCLLWPHLRIQTVRLWLVEEEPPHLFYRQTALRSEGSSGWARVSSLQSRVQRWRPFGQDARHLCAD